MRIDTSCDVAKLAVTLAQGRVLEPERGFNPFTRSIFHDVKLDGSERGRIAVAGWPPARDQIRPID